MLPLKRNNKIIPSFNEMIKDNTIFQPSAIEYGSNILEKNNLKFDIITNSHFTFFNHDGRDFLVAINSENKLIISNVVEGSLDIFSYIYQKWIVPAHLLYSFKHILYILECFLKEYKDIRFINFINYSDELFEKLFASKDFDEYLERISFTKDIENFIIYRL